MALIVDLAEKKEKNGIYHELIDQYFLNNTVFIAAFPSDISKMEEKEFPKRRITSAKEYVDYLDEEYEFWKNADPRKKLQSIVHCDRLISARQGFEQALRYLNSPLSLANSLDQSTAHVRNGVLYSKTKLSHFLLNYLDRSTSFIAGLKIGISDNLSNPIPTTVDGWEGFSAAMIYKKTYEDILSVSSDVIKDFNQNIEIATDKYSKLNLTYTQALHDQENRIAEITASTNDFIDSLSEEKSVFFESANKEISNLERIYSEKLKLSEPANYWNTVDEDYTKKGTAWFIGSIAISLIIIVGLVTFLIKAPLIFSENYHWFDNIKNSAIITVVASIAIYMLRLSVKMSMSSYHLARDARERNNLAYFYLSLIEKDAVTDKERALILNALFSRSDTGLLKGESSPTLPTNISDLVDLLNKKNT